MARYSFPALISQPAAPAAPAIVSTVRVAAPRDLLQTPLEKFFPHILSAIQAMWGYPELNVYLNKITIDTRGDREGFPPEVWDDLYLVMRLHHDVFPSLAR